MRKLGPVATVVALCGLALTIPAEAGVVTTTKAVTKELGGNTQPARGASVSGDGKLVVFETSAQLVASDTDDYSDIYLWKRSSPGSFTRLSVGVGGEAPNDDSGSPVISRDGKRVAFDSRASNLVANDTNDARDVFVRIIGGGMKRVSVSSSEQQTEIEHDSGLPSISETGKLIAFESFAPNLVAGDTNGYADIFVRNLGNGTTRRVSVKSNGTQANGDSEYAAIDPKGLFVAFTSDADNLAGTDDNGSSDVFLHHNKKTTRVSVNNNGAGANSYSEDPALSSSCQLINNKSVCKATVVFISDATNLSGNDDNDAIDVFVRANGKTKRISVDSDRDEGGLFEESLEPAISKNGRFVVFTSEADLTLNGNDDNGWPDIYLHDRTKATTKRVSVGPGGAEGNKASEWPAISADGKWVGWQSLSTTFDNLGSDNTTFDIFLRGPLF